MYENYRYTAGWKTMGNRRRKVSGDWNTWKTLEENFFWSIQTVSISKIFKMGNSCRRECFVGNSILLKKMTFGKNKIHSCDLKKQRIPHIKKSTFPFQHPGTGTLASIHFSMLIKDSPLLSPVPCCHHFIYVTLYVIAVCLEWSLIKCHTGKFCTSWSICGMETHLVQVLKSICWPYLLN